MRMLLVASVSMVVLALGCPGTAWGQDEVDETRKLNADADVMIEIVSGSITVTGWDRQEARITGEIGEDIEEFIVEGEGDELEIRIELPDRKTSFFRKRHLELDAFLEIRLPKGCRLDISTISADIELDGFDDEITVESISGDINAAGKMQAVELSSISGEIELTAEAKEVSVSSISGDVTLDGVRGEVGAETVSGDIVIDGGQFDELDCQSVSGDIEFRGTLAKNGTYDFSSHSGSIDLLLPADVDAEFDVCTFSGDIDNAYGSDGRRKSKLTPGRELRFSAGSGDASVDIQTFSGDVNIEKH